MQSGVTRINSDSQAWQALSSAGRLGLWIKFLHSGLSHVLVNLVTDIVIESSIPRPAITEQSLIRLDIPRHGQWNENNYFR